MHYFEKAQEATLRQYFRLEERRFCDRARADRVASTHVAHCLGLGVDETEAFADRVVEAGIRSSDGRGGFDFLATQIGPCGYGVEQLRAIYGTLANGMTATSLAA